MRVLGGFAPLGCGRAELISHAMLQKNRGNKRARVRPRNRIFLLEENGRDLRDVFFADSVCGNTNGHSLLSNGAIRIFALNL